MIEKTVLNYLVGKMTVPCYMETPEQPPESYVLIQKTSGTVENGIWAATLAIQSIAGTMLEAAELNEKAIAVMLDMPKTENVFGCDLNSNYNFTDTTKKKHRYQAVFDIYY